MGPRPEPIGLRARAGLATSSGQFSSLRFCNKACGPVPGPSGHKLVRWLESSGKSDSWIDVKYQEKVPKFALIED